MTTPMNRRKSKLPEANKMARMIRSGRTTGDLAIRYGADSDTIIRQLTAHGYDASTGHWVGGNKKDYVDHVPLSVRGAGPGLSVHHVGGGDNPTVISIGIRPIKQRSRPTGLAWPVNDTPFAVPSKSHLRVQPGLWNDTPKNRVRKISADQAIEIAKRYLVGEESSVTLAHEYGVNERTIRKYLRGLGVPVRTRTEALRLSYAQRRATRAVTVAAVNKDVA